MTFSCAFSWMKFCILIKSSLKFVPMGPINNIPALVQIMAWCCLGDKPLSEPMLVSLLTQICITRPQWVSNWCDPSTLSKQLPKIVGIIFNVSAKFPWNKSYPTVARKPAKVSNCLRHCSNLILCALHKNLPASCPSPVWSNCQYEGYQHQRNWP